MLSIRNIHAGYGDKPVLHDVSAEVKSGEFLGLIGPNGCGKTTLLRIISGVLAPQSGQVLLNGADVRSIPRPQLAKIMACLSQSLALDFAFTVREVTLLGREPHLPRLGYQTPHDREVCDRAMALADVSHLADRPVTEISGGERQRAFIAMCLAQEPQILLLDEPTSHLDIGHQLLVLELIRNWNRSTGTTVVAVLHDLNLAAEYCDRLLVLDKGVVEALGSAAEILTADMIYRVYGAKVATEPNPISRKPHVILAAGSAGTGAHEKP